jgi:ABC-2 type transport system ATP-binding protein
MSVIHTEHLSKRYGRRTGIEAVDLDVSEGKIFGFLGPNGAGKTTTIRLLLGFLPPTRGRGEVFGRDCWRDSARIKQDVGYLPGDLRLYPWMTATTALKICGRIRGIDMFHDGRELADRFRLESDVRVRHMSRGMRQKLGLILALTHRPRLLVLDEPTTGLDPLMQKELADCLRELAAAGHTVFFSSHTLSEVEQLCDHVAIVREGRVVADESLASLRSRARRRVTLVFRDAEAAQGATPPSFLTVTERRGDCWQAEMTGDAQHLVRWLANQPLRDVSIGQPDLDSLFRQFYASREEPS